jgi:hypothetical protein
MIGAVICEIVRSIYREIPGTRGCKKSQSGRSPNIVQVILMER